MADFLRRSWPTPTQAFPHPSLAQLLAPELMAGRREEIERNMPEAIEQTPRRLRLATVVSPA